MKKNGIEFESQIGTWCVASESNHKGKKVFLLESEKYGDQAAGLIVDENCKLIMKDVYNGFSDLDNI